MARTRKGTKAAKGVVAKVAKSGMGNPAKKVGKRVRVNPRKMSGPGKPDFKDSKGRLRDGQTGKIKHDPNRPKPRYSRSSEYPHGYSDKTHGEMAKKWTKEGRDPAQRKDADGWPLDSSGNKIPRDNLTWYDKRGRKVQPPVTYDHDPAIVEHWNKTGSNSDRATRNTYYDNHQIMEPMNGPLNSSKGAKLQGSGVGFTQNTGPNYRP